MGKQIFGKNVNLTLGDTMKKEASVLIIIDMQNDICSEGGHYDKCGKNLSPINEIKFVKAHTYSTNNGGSEKIYYRMKGYDNNGRPTKAKLQELNIEWVADMLNLKEEEN